MQSLVDTEHCSSCQWNTLEVVYRDPDGVGGPNQVTATLHEVSNNGLAEQLITIFDPITGRPRAVFDPSEIVTFDSNTVAAHTAAVQTHTVGFAHNFNFEDNAYYVLLKVKRSRAGVGNNPTVFVVRLLLRVFQG